MSKLNTIANSKKKCGIMKNDNIRNEHVRGSVKVAPAWGEEHVRGSVKVAPAWGEEHVRGSVKVAPAWAEEHVRGSVKWHQPGQKNM